MYETIRIRNLRAIKELQLDDLARINILVGANGSGKTSVLEAVELLHAAVPETAMEASVRRRGEDTPQTGAEGASHAGKLINAGAEDERFEVFGTWRDPGSGRVTNGLISFSAPDEADRNEETRTPAPWRGATVWKGRRRDEPVPDSLLPEARRSAYVGVHGCGHRWTAEHIDAISGDDRMESARVMFGIGDPAIEGIATARPLEGSAEQRARERKVFARYADGEPVPYTRLGEGARRLIEIGAGLGAAAGGVLLVDDIEHGLSDRRLHDFWEALLAETARLQVQVFGATHSAEVYETLGRTIGNEPQAAELYRIERDRERAVRVSGEALTALRERHVELR